MGGRVGGITSKYYTETRGMKVSGGQKVKAALALQLADGGPELENLGAQPQDPVRVRLILHRALPKLSAAPDRAQRIADCLDGAKAHPVANVRQNIATAGSLPFADQQVDFPAQIHLRQGPFRAVAIAIDEVTHRRLHIGHLQPQGTDLASNFINSVVHGLLEQNKNI